MTGESDNEREATNRGRWGENGMAMEEMAVRKNIDACRTRG